MGRYSKTKSDYIKSKRHQTLSDGSTIFERDWVTVGNGQLGKLEPGKRVYYSDSNFIFTVSANQDYKKKHSSGKWLGSFYLPDVNGNSDEVNTVRVNFKSNDLRNYAYYGSAVELVKTSIENIIMEFPGRLDVSDTQFTKLTPQGTWVNVGKIITNQFGIDMHTDQVEVDDYTNELRFLSRSWANYNFIDYNNVVRNITSYTITDFTNKVPMGSMYHSVGYDLVYYNGKLFKWSTAENDYVLADFTGSCQNYFVRCNEYIKYRDEYYQWSDEDMCYNPIFVYEICDDDNQVLFQIDLTIEGEDTELDRTVIDEIGDPIMHLLRNSLDHGIEMPDEREAKGKPRVGEVGLIARHEGNNVVIMVTDDGKGIDADVIRRKAVEKEPFKLVCDGGGGLRRQTAPNFQPCGERGRPGYPVADQGGHLGEDAREGVAHEPHPVAEGFGVKDAPPSPHGAL